ncbi:unnamed protein product, partial [Urochloa humidicola]
TLHPAGHTARTNEAAALRRPAAEFGVRQDHLPLLAQPGFICCCSTVSTMAPSSTSSCSTPKDHQYNLRSKRAKRAPKVVSVCQSSKRASRVQVVDGPPKKKKKKSVSMEDCINTVAKIFAASLRREQEEVDRALQMLEQDGVCKGSVRYLKAKSLFRDSNTRDVFTKMESAEVRLVWIDWSWKHRRGSS